MTDEVLSTTITESPTVSGGGIVNPPAEQPQPQPDAKPDSLRDTIEAEAKRARTPEPKPEAKAEPKAEEKPKDEAKPEAKTPEAQPQKSATEPTEAEDAAAQQEDGDKSSEGKKPDPAARTRYDSPPEKVAHHARAKWANVPSELKAEFHRIVEAQDSETRQYQEDRQFRESLKEYDELAKKAGTTVKDAMARYVDVDKRLNSTDANTRARTMLELMQSSNVDPVQFARAILQNEQQFKQQPQQARPDPMVQQMARQVQELTQRLAQQDQAQRTAPLVQTVEQFAAERPDFHDLEEDIAEILKSGIIDRRFPGLSPDQKLAEAYRRAGGAHLPSQPDTQAAMQDPPTQAPEPPRPVNPDAGRKSIAGAPSGGKTPVDTTKGKSLRELLAEETRKKRA